MRIEYTKEGMRIIHSTGSNQFITLEELYRLWNEAKAYEKETEQCAEEIHNHIKEVEASQ